MGVQRYVLVFLLSHVQVYRRMDIGSAKVDGETRAAVPHHLIDVVDPCQTFSVGEYCKMARSVIEVW